MSLFREGIFEYLQGHLAQMSSKKRNNTDWLVE